MVIIKDFDAPRNCVDCQNEGLSEMVGCGLFDECGKHPDCPFIEIKEGDYNGTPIPDNATNRDIIKAMFPNSEIYTDVVNGIADIEICEDNSELRCSVDWLNAPYDPLDCIPSEYDLSEDIELSNPQMYR